MQSEDLKLVLKCSLASLGYPVQNKAVTVGAPQAVTPPIKEDIYIFLLGKFEQFWMAYPEKKSAASMDSVSKSATG